MKSRIRFPIPGSKSNANYILKKEAVGRHSMHRAIRLSASPLFQLCRVQETYLSPDMQESLAQGPLHLSAAGHWRLQLFTSTLAVSPLGFLPNFPTPQHCRGILQAKRYTHFLYHLKTTMLDLPAVMISKYRQTSEFL